MINYTNNTYVILQILQASLQHCCWAPYQIAEQATTVNLVTLRGSWGGGGGGGVLFWIINNLEWNRRQAIILIH